MDRNNGCIRLVSAVCCAAMIVLPLQDTWVAAAAPDPSKSFANSLRAVQDGENTAPRDHWDPAYVEAQLGDDPARTFAWVRDHTYWIPYHGVLRGPVGVLMDRQGDSLDRALLLATLFAGEHKTVRLAHGTINGNQAATLMPSLLGRRFVHTLGVHNRRPSGATTSWTTLAAKYQIDPAAVVKTFQAQTAVVNRQHGLLRARLSDQARRLAAAVAPATDSGRSNAAHALAALADHWWVQTQEGTVWKDWDLASGTANRALATADRTVDAANVPADLYHRITLRVVGERWLNGATSEQVVLEHAWTPATTIGQPIGVTFSPNAWPKPFPAPGMTVDQTLRTFAVDQHEWTPILSIGKDHFQQNAITDGGDITMSTNSTDVLAVARNATRGLGAAINDVFGTPAPAAAKPAAAAAGQFLTATWLEYRIDSPGETPQTIRRDVFDLLGPTARAAKSTAAPKIDDPAKLSRGLSMLMNTEILPVVSELSPQYVNHLAAQSLLANRALLSDAVANNVGSDFAAAQAVSGRAAPAPGDLYRLALSRFAMSGMEGLVFVDRPNVLTRHQVFSMQGAKLAPKIATDIVSAGVGVDPLGPSPFLMRLTQGVFDTNAEAVLISERPDAGGVAWAYDGAKDWVTLTSPSDPKLATLGLSADVRQRIASALSSGHIVVAPKGPVAVSGGAFVGWWQIDKVSGETLGMGEKGWGQELAEYALIVYVAAAQGFLFSYLMCVLTGGANCVKAGLIGGAISGATAGVGLGLGALFGSAAGVAGTAGEGIAGGLAGEEGSLGSGLAGEGAGAGEGAAAGEAGGAGGAGAGPSGGSGFGPNGEVPNVPRTPGETEEMMRDAERNFADAQNRGDKEGVSRAVRQMVRLNPSTPQEALDILDHDYGPGGVGGNPNPFGGPGAGSGGTPPTGSPGPTSPLATTVPPGGGGSTSPLATTVPPGSTPPATGGGGTVPMGGSPTIPGGGSTSPLATTVPPGGGSTTVPMGGSPTIPGGGSTSPLATTVPPGGGSTTVPMGGSPTIPGGGSTSPLATTVPPGGGSTTVPMGGSPTIPGCTPPGCTPGGGTTLVGLGGAIGALGGGS